MGNRNSPQAVIDATITFAVILAVRLYQILLSRWIGRKCQFRTSCSRFALQQLHSCDWRLAIQATKERLNDCCGSYSLRMNEAAQVEMLTISGRKYAESELAEYIVERIRAFILPPHPHGTGSSLPRT